MSITNGKIELDQVSKYFGTNMALGEMDLTIEDGAYCCLIGPSGCGKSTILRLVAGHDDPTSGIVRIGGQNVNGMPPLERRTAMMFQSYALFPHLSVRDNISFSYRVRGVSEKERGRAADEMIEKVRLEEFAQRLPEHLSGGQRQRVALARAAITKPKVLLLDEPLSALDEQLRVEMRGELRQMQRDLGITFVHVTHTQIEAIALADQVVVMDTGKVIQSASAREVFISPSDRYVAEFMGGQNVMSALVKAVDGDRVDLVTANNGQLSVNQPKRGTISSGQSIDIAVRRDTINLAPLVDAETVSKNNVVTGRVQAIEYQGYVFKVTLEIPSGEEFVVLMNESKFFASPFEVGTKMSAIWDVEDTITLIGSPASPVTDEEATANELRA